VKRSGRVKRDALASEGRLSNYGRCSIISVVSPLCSVTIKSESMSLAVPGPASGAVVPGDRLA